MPYLYRAALQAHAEGVPMMRAMVLEFPGDPACTHLDRQYMLGDDLLVAPVFGAAGEVVVLRAGRHLDALPDRRGGHRAALGHRAARLHERPAAGPARRGHPGRAPWTDRPDYDYADGVTLQVYRLPEGAARTVTVPVADPRRQPAAFTVSRDRDVIRASAAGPAGRWQLLLAGVPAVGPVTGGTAAAHEHGTLIRADGGAVEVALSGGPARPGPGPAAHPGGTAW